MERSRILMVVCILICGNLFHLALASNNEKFVHFSHVVAVFEKCLINIVNYKDVDLPPPNKPIMLITQSSAFSVTSPVLFKDRWACVVQIYVVPTNSRNVTSSDMPDIETFKSFIFRQLPEVFRGSIQGSYKILIKDPTDTSQLNSWLKSFFSGSNISYFLMTMRNTRDLTYVNGEIAIVNRFKLFQHQLQLTTAHFEVNRRNIDALIASVNDIGRNIDVPWTLVKYGNLDTMEELKGDNAPTQSLQQYLESHIAYDIPSLRFAFKIAPFIGINDDGYENFIMASHVLGGNISIRENGGVPSIIFDTLNSRYFQSTEMVTFAFATCSDNFKVFISYNTLQVLTDLVTIFDSRVWQSIAYTYILPMLFFGFIYHFSGIKKKMHRKRWMKYGQFVIGLTALVNQCVDRKVNGKRFGFMGCLVAPWLIIGVVLSHAFRGDNITSLFRKERWVTTWPYFQSLQLNNVTVVTDISNLYRFHQIIDVASEFTATPTNYSSIARYLIQNEDIAYASWSNRVSSVSAMLNKRRCKHVKVYYAGWPIDSYVKRWRPGWKISNWVDYRILQRISSLVESGIRIKWAEMIDYVVEEIPNRRIRAKSHHSSTVTAISMTSNISTIFLVGLYTLSCCVGVWLLEGILYFIYSRYCKRPDKNGKQKESKGNVFVPQEQGEANIIKIPTPGQDTSSVAPPVEVLE